jgi:hypothetical protein
MPGVNRDRLRRECGPQTGIDETLRKSRMNKMMRFALMAALLALVTTSANAQSTNVVQRANFVLKGTTQTSSGVSSVRVVNKDILAALNATGEYNFGPKATLLFVSADDDQPPALIVQEGSGQQVTNTDVGNYFGVTEIGDSVRSPDDSTRWETWNFAFNNGNTNETAFQLWGSTTIHRGTIHTSGIGTLAGPQHVQSDVRGVGRVHGAITVFSGHVDGANPTLVKEE